MICLNFNNNINLLKSYLKLLKLKAHLYNTDENPIRAKFIRKIVKENSWWYKNKHNNFMFYPLYIDITMDRVLDGNKKGRVA